jgi:uncharacterized membrane protein (DUF106 family)
MFEAITDMYFGFLSLVFSPVLGLPSYVSLTIIAGLIVFITTLFYKYMVDQNAIKALKEEQKAISAKAKEMQKEDPEKASKLMGEALKLTNKQMKMNMKPMMAAIVVAFIVLPWIGQTFVEPIFILPFSLPLLGAEVGWLAWYFVVAIVLSTTFRKILGVAI